MIIDILKSRFVTHTPLVLTHMITSLCNARCKTCDLWKKSSEYKNDLTQEEICNMLKEAKDIGMVGYVVWGGEPLLRNDLPQILQIAKQNNFHTTIITNGFSLKEKYMQVTPFTDCLIVSIDANGTLHDEMRGVEGILERAIEGIKLCKKTKTKIIINSVVSKLNLDKLDGLFELSKELDVPLAFEPMEINAGYNEHLRPTDEELKKAFSKIVEYKKSGHRVNNSLRYLQNFTKQKRYTCHAPKCFITVGAHGNLSSCISLNQSWGNIRKKSLKELFNGKNYKDFCKKMESCNHCDVSCVVESSLAYSLNPAFLFDTLRLLNV